MEKIPPNPYRDLSLNDLHTAMHSRARELLKTDNPVGRRDTAYLLLSAASKIAPRTGHPTSPAHEVAAGHPVAAVYGAEYERQARALRYNILIHAADAIGVGYDQRKLVTNATWQAASGLAQRDDAGLMEALALLDSSRRPV
jgi:hypothetical protein